MVMGLEDDIADCAISWFSQMLFCALLDSVVMSARESVKSLPIFFWLMSDVAKEQGQGPMRFCLAQVR